MTTIDMKFAIKGQRVPLLGALDQGRYHIDLGTQHTRELYAAGWRPEDLAEMVELVGLLDTQHAHAVEARADSKANYRREQSAIDDAKTCKRKLVLAFTDLHALGLVTPEDFDIVYRSGDLRRSSPRISSYLADVRKPVERYAALVDRYFNEESALSMIDAIKAELDAAQSKQEVDLATLPEETLKIYELKGRLLTLIERMNRCGKIAFDGQAHLIGRFNKDLVRRSRSIRRSQSGVEPASGGDTKPAAADG